ncbi:hypothetical protein J6590_016921 [Homalodisca vitripennis]|nr:hypothetical protein J6590_016921 [Homalodisca vitripennis]
MSAKKFDFTGLLRYSTLLHSPKRRIPTAAMRESELKLNPTFTLNQPFPPCGCSGVGAPSGNVRRGRQLSAASAPSGIVCRPAELVLEADTNIVAAPVVIICRDRQLQNCLRHRDGFTCKSALSEKLLSTII